VTDTGESTRRPVMTAVRVIAVLVIVLAIVFIGGRAGRELLGPGPLDHLRGGLQQVQTTGGTYIGRITSRERGALVLADPAIVTAVAEPDGTPTGEFVVQVLASDPYGIDGPAVLLQAQVALVGDVAPTSQLAAAYREATGEVPAPSSAP